MNQTIAGWKNELQNAARPEKIKILSSFFKTGKGEYGEGDIFIGVVVPENRKIAQRYFNLPLDDIEQMIKHEIHEFRISGLFALVYKYRKEKNPEAKQAIVDFYLANADKCNNWDLVDLSAPYILGEHLIDHPSPTLLDELSSSTNLWRQRIAIVSTLTLIRHNLFEDTLRIAKRYLSHQHPLIHKATGWMLREVGKRDETVLLEFLNSHCPEMPRTALRYAIERFDEEKRRHYMSISKKCK